MENHANADGVNQQSSHATHAVSSSKKGLIWSLILTGSFFVVELTVGFLIGSVAVIADGFHNFSAAAGIGIALVATILASRPPSPGRTFGFSRVEMFAAWLNGILLMGMAALILFKGIDNLLNPKEVAPLPMLILSIIGLVIGGIPAILLYKKQKTDINARGAFWHVMETVFGSVAVLAASLTIYFTGWIQADAIFGMLLAPILVIASWGIIAESTKTLLDLTPKGLDLLRIKDEMDNVPGVEGVHHMHAWNLSSGRTVFSSHIKVSEDVDSNGILQEVSQHLKSKFNIYFSTIQTETECTNVEEPRELDFL